MAASLNPKATRQFRVALLPTSAHASGSAFTGLIVREFKKSGITEAQLARRWGKTPDIAYRAY
jgi:hypothetical protein